MKIGKRRMGALIAAAALALTAVLFAACSGGPSGDGGFTKQEPRILNADGSYGGSLDEEKYGKGAPKNGEYDVPDSAYYVVNNDFYNMCSTDTRVILPKFATYQQTMADSSGIACLVMILNYMGKDVSKQYSELELLKLYEKVNDTTVYLKGTREEGLIKLVDALGLGYKAEKAGITILSGDSKTDKREKVKSFITETVSAGRFLLVRYQSPNGYGWKIAVGFDSMGEVRDTNTGEYIETFVDDTIIFAEPNDGCDHCQDGFTVERMDDFIAWWRKMSEDGTVKDSISYIVIDTGAEITLDVQPRDESVKQTLYDIHLPLNPDGTYGGARDLEKYGEIKSGWGWYDHPDANYYKISDFYNMGSEGSRVMLPGYSVLQQTMGSSCGICAVNGVLKYYGTEEESQYDLELIYLNDYERINNATVKGSGTGVSGHAKVLAEWGYTHVEYSSAKKGKYPIYTTCQAFERMVRDNLEAGRPVVVSTNMGSGHYLTIIGFDDMGTEWLYDDVFVCANSNDVWDGYQDGYDVYSAFKFFSQHTNGSYSTLQSCLVIYNEKYENKKQAPMILNADGSYGGTLDEIKYGKGAPKNGEYDVPDSDYYVVNNDFYSMGPTDTRLMLSRFAPYQQTMEDSSGIACLMMILNYMGEDVADKYSELALVNKYEEITGKKVYGKGTGEDGLIKLIDSLGLGYKAEKAGITISDSNTKTEKQTKTREFLQETLKAGKFLLVRYQSPNGYGWKVVIGYDDLGEVPNTRNNTTLNAFGDDVIIFAEPNDGYDHRQDGYAVERMLDFLAWWRNMAPNGDMKQTYSYLVIDTGREPAEDLTPVSPLPEPEKQTLYDIHLPRNPDGTYGGTRDYDLYGEIKSGCGTWNHTDSNYYKINDFYNMSSEGTRVMLSGYSVLQQTMGSSCGICAVNGVLKYYGHEEASQYDMELSYLLDYERINKATVKGSGTGIPSHVKVLAEWGYKTVEYSSAKKGNYPKYNPYSAYISMIRENLEAGRPVVVSTNMGSGHYLTVIGFDDMGTDYIYDDVFITADSCDYWDGYQDGYDVCSAFEFYSQHTNSSFSTLQSLLVIYNEKSD